MFVQCFAVRYFLCFLALQVMKRDLIALLCLLGGSQCEKTCLRGMRYNKGADQHAHPRRLISAFVFHVLESIIFKLATSINSFF